MELRIAGIDPSSIVDGPGLRLVVFAQGCPHACPGCHNPQTQVFEDGQMINTQILLDRLAKNPLLDGITLSGGEPFAQAAACAHLAQSAHALGKNVVTYTGYTLESLLLGLPSHPDWQALLQDTDLLIDGPFVQNLLCPGTPYRGSSNQRLLDAKASLEQRTAVPFLSF